MYNINIGILFTDRVVYLLELSPDTAYNKYMRNPNLVNQERIVQRVKATSSICRVDG